MTASIVLLSPGEAQRLTQRIKLTASTVRDNLFKLRNYVEEAKRSNVWQVLGFQSWTAYLADTLADEPMRLGREERQELVGYLSGEGLSTRAIAPIVGADRKTVMKDVRQSQVVQSGPPASVETQVQYDSGEWSRDVEVAAPVEDPQPPRAATVPENLAAVRESVAVIQETVARSVAALTVRNDTPNRAVTGLDGKTYSVPTSPKPKRRALTDQSRDVGYDLRKVAERLQRIREDDRLARNKEEVAALIKGHLMFTVEVCQDLLDELNQ